MCLLFPPYGTPDQILVNSNKVLAFLEFGLEFPSFPEETLDPHGRPGPAQNWGLQKMRSEGLTQWVISADQWLSILP